MIATDVISLDAAKNHLVVLNDDFYDAQITGLINSAIAFVEQYTQYRLYQRNVTYPINGCSADICDFPLTIQSVTNADTTPFTGYQTRVTPLRSYVFIPAYNWNQPQLTINALIGYLNVSDIPGPLLSAAYKTLTYLFENKDLYGETIPSDLQLLLNPYRRGSSGI